VRAFSGSENFSATSLATFEHVLAPDWTLGADA
jgi:hypothetical protein